MTTPNVNAPVMMPAGAQEITSGKAKSDREEQSFMDVLSIADSASKVRKQEPAAGTEVKADPKTQTTNTKETSKPQDTQNDTSEGSEKSVKDNTKTEKKEASSDNVKTDENVGKVEKAVDEVKDAIKEVLDITDDELAVLMETLNLTNTDLLDPKVAAEIVATVKEVTPVDLVADASLTETITDLQGSIREIVSDLIQDMDITPEEFKNTLAEIKNEYEVVTPKPETKENTVDFGEVMTKAEDEIDKAPVSTVRTPAEAVKKEEAAPDRTERISDDAKGDDKVSLNVTVKDQSGSEGSASDDHPDDILRSEGRVRHTESHVHNTTENSIFFQNLNQAVENTLEISALQEGNTPLTAGVNARELIEQIQNQIRAVIDTETQSLSMQLHPQSLGRLNVELVARAGQLTAQFEAENASVKAALETRIIELKETLEQRGIRVESVEVTIASHEFEQNLMGGEQSGDGTQEGGRRSQRTRNINLNELESGDTDGEVITEEERIARDMMAANGNSVDFTA